jgi:peptidoglycan/xylan/chitin deacetylase (PgdA/CDA1 family)
MKYIKYFVLLFVISCSSSDYFVYEKTYVIIAFDDGMESVYDNALPILSQYNFPAVNCINTGFIGNDGRQTWEQVEDLEFDFGWETAGHSFNHPNLLNCDDEELEYQLSEDKSNLVEHGLSHDTFAIPNGQIREDQFEIVSRYFKNIRSSRDIKFHFPIDRKYLGYFPYETNHEPEDAIARVLRGVENKEVIVILGFHAVNTDDGTNPYNCNANELQIIAEFLHSNNFKVITIKDAVVLFSE